MPNSLASVLSCVDESVARAFADLGALQTAATAAQASLQQAMREAQRAAALVDFDDAALQEFLTKPYLVRPLGGSQYELIVPRFIGFRAGWPVRHEGPYTVFLVSKFINLLAPLPDWLAGELGFAAPSFGAELDGNILTVTGGDPAAVMDKLGGAKVVARREGNRLFLRPASRFDILRRIIREEGFLPYTPQPISADLRRESQIARDDKGKPAFTLRPHQARDYQRFMESGAVSVFSFPQTGKSYLSLQAFADLKGPKLILCPRRSLVDQWQARLALFLTPEAAREVTVATYQGARMGARWTDRPNRSSSVSLTDHAPCWARSWDRSAFPQTLRQCRWPGPSKESEKSTSAPAGRPASAQRAVSTTTCVRRALMGCSGDRDAVCRALVCACA